MTSATAQKKGGAGGLILALIIIVALAVWAMSAVGPKPGNPRPGDNRPPAGPVNPKPPKP